MIDGIQVMTLTQQLNLLSEQIERGEHHSSIRVADHLTRLRKAANALAWAIEMAPEPPANAIEHYQNASKGT